MEVSQSLRIEEATAFFLRYQPQSDWIGSSVEWITASRSAHGLKRPSRIGSPALLGRSVVGCVRESVISISSEYGVSFPSEGDVEGVVVAERPGRRAGLRDTCERDRAQRRLRGWSRVHVWVVHIVARRPWRGALLRNR